MMDDEGTVWGWSNTQGIGWSSNVFVGIFTGAAAEAIKQYFISCRSGLKKTITASGNLAYNISGKAFLRKKIDTD